jgi:hypothetical protein
MAVLDVSLIYVLKLSPLIYNSILVAAIALGAAGVGAYPTETSPAVVLYGGR